MPSHSIQITCRNGSFECSTNIAVTPPAEVSASESIATATTDGLIDVAWPFANMTSLFLQSDQNVLVETNSGSAPDDSFTLVANVPLVWFTGFVQANPITADVTGIYVTNVSGQTATIELLVGYNSTP
jgi:hypothetical protein